MCYTQAPTHTHPPTHTLREVQRRMFGKMEWWNLEACFTVKGDDYTGSKQTPTQHDLALI